MPTKKGSYTRVGKSSHTRKKSKTMFQKAKSKKFSDMIRIDSVTNAEQSVSDLLREFKSAKTRQQKIRIIQYATLAANRCIASANRKNLFSREKRELKAVAEVYRTFVKNNRLT